MLGPAQIAASGPSAGSFLIGLSISIVVTVAWSALLVRALRRRRAGLWAPPRAGSTRSGDHFVGRVSRCASSP